MCVCEHGECVWELKLKCVHFLHTVCFYKALVIQLSWSLLSTLRWFMILCICTCLSPLTPFLPLGLSSAGPLWGDPDPGGGGEAHHTKSPEPSATSVGSARLRVCVTHTRSQSQSYSAQIQQLQRTVPEQLGMFGFACVLMGKIIIKSNFYLNYFS